MDLISYPCPNPYAGLVSSFIKKRILDRSANIVENWLLRPHNRFRINKLSLEQNDRHFADDIFKCIFNYLFYAFIQILLKFVSTHLLAEQVTSHKLHQVWPRPSACVSRPNTDV